MADPRSYVVLHIDDDELVRTSMAALLVPLGYQLLSAGDGSDALARLADHERVPDVLLVDAQLPGEMDGADSAQEVCRRLGHVVPVILMSGALSTANMPWLPGAPMVCFWKPVNHETLLEMIATFARLGRFIRGRPRSPR
jgi:two-component system, chemotaxis family, CheB/CheR fusion protein